MWSRGGLNRSRGMGNPTLGDNNSAHTSPSADSMRIEPISKGLPSLPEGSDDENNTPTRAREALAVAQDGNEWRYSAVSPMASPTLETVHDSGSSFCVSPIDESNGFPRQEQRASTGEYFADAQLNALYVDTPPSPPSAPSPPRKRKVVAFVAEPEQIPPTTESFSPAERPQQTLETGPGVPICRDFEYHKAVQEPVTEVSTSQPVHEAAFRSFSPPPISNDLASHTPPAEQPTGAHRHVHSGEPTNPIAKNPSQTNPQNTTVHKSVGSASNLLSWGREQLLPIKEFAQARSRGGNFYKSEIPVPIRGKESRLKDGHQSASRVVPIEVHSRRPSANNAGVQLSHLGLVPSTVTTITAGSPKASPKRPAPRDTYNKQWREQRDTKPLPKINTVAETLPPLADFGGTTALPKPDSPSPRESPKDTPRDTPRDSPRDRDSPRISPRESPQPDSTGTSQTMDDAPSIMSRQRPIPISMPVSRKPIRKPIPAEAAQEPDPVPQPPTDPVDRIQALEAKRDGLARRRINLETVIKELTRVIQPNNVAYDLAAKQEVKRSVQSIENDIAEIKREEHELGLKAARAWRRLDENNNGDGSTLWVKRVTS